VKNLTKIFSTCGTYTLSSVPEGAEGFVLAEIAAIAPKSLLHIARDDSEAEKLCAAVKFFHPEVNLLYFPAWDCLPYDRISPSPEIVSRRLEALANIAVNDDKFLIITTVNAALQRVPPKELIFDSLLQMKIGDEIARGKIISYLETNGYSRASAATQHGEYAIRGSIIDIFPPGLECALRLDFLGDMLEDIRSFDPITQMSKEKLSRFDLMPASEVIFSAAAILRFQDNYRAMFGAVTSDDALFTAISEARKYSGFEHWLPLFYEKLETLFDYLPEALITLAPEAKPLIEKRLETIAEYYKARQDYSSLHAKTGEAYKALPPDSLYMAAPEFSSILAGRTTVNFYPFKMDEAAENNIDASYSPAENYFLKSKELLQSPFEIMKGDMGAIAFHITCFSEGTKSRIQYLLREHGLPFADVNIWDDAHKNPGKIGTFILPLDGGFQNSKLTILSEQDLVGPKVMRSGRRKIPPEKFLSEAYNFAPGEIIVHKEHGIGRFEGLETLIVSGVPHECLKLVYDGGDKLYVPVENIDLLSRYGGAEAAAALDKLGGASWQARKARLKERIKLAAEEIIKIAAERALKTSDILSPPEGSYNEFCARFPFTETDDQLRAIQDVEADLASGRPMNRLICGDVGFGKTEVAMRAAFIALGDRLNPLDNPLRPSREGAGGGVSLNNDSASLPPTPALPLKGGGRSIDGIGGQVAVIAPTTLLCRQHYKNFRERFSGFPVNIRQLSRMVTASQANETRKLLREGEVDIIIGTHALLAKNVGFQKLALLIVDEEQHFGVAQKEHIKKLEADINVLTLSATPIPRTLQMSLTGIRDLSLIATPPVDRLAVRTYIMPYDPVVIREALLRERGRGGRTFYVAPRIKDLDAVAMQLAAIVPEMKIAIAHGQLKPAELDGLMNDFYDGKYDILLSTSIIESGIDIASANTLIVHRSDMFGLAQLYQLRGRVGRSNVRAYAYFTLQHNRMISRDATKRLEVMQKLDSLGAGFTLATYDMDIRGFGNLLGDEQSGNIKEVGVELYEQMLREAIEDLRKDKESEARQQKNFSPQINIGISVLIPETYIGDLTLRLGFYRRIAALEKPEDLDDIAAEMVDRFGPLPEEVEHLLKVIEIKQLCRNSGIEKLDAGPKGLVLSFRGNKFAKPEELIKFISANQNTIKLRADHRLVFMDQDWERIETRMKGIRESIEKIRAFAA